MNIKGSLQMPKYAEIFIDYSLFELAKRGSGTAKQKVLQLAIDHLESELPMPVELQRSLVEVLSKLIPNIKSDKGFHENGFAAWKNAMEIQSMLDCGQASSLEDAFFKVAEQSSRGELDQPVSMETLKKHWGRFGRYAQSGDTPPLDLLGDFSSKGQGKKKR
jgi:hypothetical protein